MDLETPSLFVHICSLNKASIFCDVKGSERSNVSSVQRLNDDMDRERGIFDYQN